MAVIDDPAAESHKPRVQITYCPRCRWLLRAAELEQRIRDRIAPDRGLGHSDG